ncbi:MAG: hypothetical protein KY467_17140 [Gemmatimonadetes bacterium]|nr:hypothetical protein [Gemmatimonadota bacterium]
MRFARLPFLLTVLFASSGLLGACGDDPLFPEVRLSVDTVTLTVPGGTAPSAIDLVRIQPPFTILRRPELVQDAGEWDVALRATEAGGLVLRPFGQPGSPLRGAGLLATTRDYDSIDEAPRTVSAYLGDPVPATVGAVYFIRSRQYPAGGGGLCVNYAKAKVLAVDAAAGTAQLALTINDNCDDERLEED